MVLNDSILKLQKIVDALELLNERVGYVLREHYYVVVFENHSDQNNGLPKKL